MIFASSYASLPDRFYAPVETNAVPAPQLLVWNRQLGAELGLESLARDETELARLLSGAANHADGQAIALAYAGHQFGYFVPRLGDGRAALIGEAVDRDGRAYDIQLKGSGRTPFSRGGDGKSSLGPVIREYIVSEAMHHLGVPTTRALAAVATGEHVYRDDVSPGAVLTRVASSHLRVGTFEYFAASNDVEGLRLLTDYAIDRHYPEARNAANPFVAFLQCVAERQAELVAAWMSLGFIHGVMNTDNTAIAGETLDYGPCAFIDEFRFDKVFSSIDRQGRYAYRNQPMIAQWNVARLAECLLLLDDAKAHFETVIGEFPGRYESFFIDRMRRKLGLSNARPGDDELIREWLQHLEDNELDFTLSFRMLASRAGAMGEPEFGEFEARWRHRLADQDVDTTALPGLMNSVNPLFIPRNHRVQEAIDTAVEGNLSIFRDLNAVLSRPFDEQPEHADYARAPGPHERVTQTFCGT